MINDYVCANLFSKEECEKLRDVFFENVNESLKDVPAQGVTKSSIVYLANYGHLKEVLYKANQFALHINKTYYGYDLHQLSDHDVLFLNVYDWNKESSYGWHKDLTQDVDNFDYKLTMLINISDDYYQGGELRIFTNGGEKIVHEFNQTGSVCIFPSWIPHSVSNVTLGIRKTITQFYLGPRFR